MSEVIHNHWIIQQIIPAPANCYAVFASWPRNTKDGNRVSVETVFERVPAMALVSYCMRKLEFSSESCEVDLSHQKVVACVRGDFDTGEYIPVCYASVRETNNYKFLGLYYNDDEWESEEDWRALAEKAYLEAVRAREKKAQKNAST